MDRGAPRREKARATRAATDGVVAPFGCAEPSHCCVRAPAVANGVWPARRPNSLCSAQWMVLERPASTRVTSGHSQAPEAVSPWPPSARSSLVNHHVPVHCRHHWRSSCAGPTRPSRLQGHG